jgi:hypothetical protein
MKACGINEANLVYNCETDKTSGQKSCKAYFKEDCPETLPLQDLRRLQGLMPWPDSRSRTTGEVMD